MTTQLRWHPAPYNSGEIADSPHGRYYVKRAAPQSRKWTLSINGTRTGNTYFPSKDAAIEAGNVLFAQQLATKTRREGVI